MTNTITVVFNFNCPKTHKRMLDEWKAFFVELNDNDPVIVTALSQGDEMTKLDLIEFGREIGDIHYIGEVLDNIQLPEKLQQLLKIREYANEHSVTDQAAYEYILEA
jgi:hypothetical protein